MLWVQLIADCRRYVKRDLWRQWQLVRRLGETPRIEKHLRWRLYNDDRHEERFASRGPAALLPVHRAAQLVCTSQFSVATDLETIWSPAVSTSVAEAGLLERFLSASSLRGKHCPE